MPRIIPEQLLNCLKVLLDKNGGILSVSEVKRLAGLMTKYSKKLVSKCIYVLILKNTKTELLGEFMAAGGWSLVYTWLNDAIRAMNWPLVQEILELLLLCPVDVNRLKINSSPKLVKGLCKDGGTEGVRILARCLVDQWLKIVTENTASIQAKNPIPAPTTLHNLINTSTPVPISTKVLKQTVEKAKELSDMKEEDPLAGVGNTAEHTTSYKLTPAQRKASEKGLVFKIVVKDGQQTLSKVPNPTKIAVIHPVVKNDTKILVEENDEMNADDLIEEDTFETNEETDSLEKSESNSEKVEKSDKNIIPKDKINQLKNKSSSDSSKYKKERSNSIDMVDKKDDKDKIKEKDKDKKKKSSSSSSSRKSSEDGSSTKPKSSSSSSHKSSKDKHRSSSKSSSSKRDKDKKEGEESSKHRSSSSSKPSSSSSSSKNRSKDSDREKERSSSSLSLSSSSNQKKSKETNSQVPGDSSKEKRADTLPKTLPSISKLGRIPKKTPAADSSSSTKGTSIVIPSKKASISIEVRRDTEKCASVKTYKSQFRSHGLTEEAPPPPSRKSLKKPVSSSTTSVAAITTTLTPALKRPSPPPPDVAIESKKSKIDLSSISTTSDKPGAIKLIPAKKIATLVETNIFSDALLAATGPKKNVKRKRSSDGKSKDVISPPTSPDGGKTTALKFYQDTLEEAKGEDKSNVQNDSEYKTNDNKKSNNTSSIKDNKLTEKEKDNSFEDDDIPLKKVKEDIDNQLQSEKENNELEEIEKVINDDDEVIVLDKEEKKPGPGCGPDGPPGVLLLHRRKGPKKKLTWRPQEQLEQIRFFELDETERVNVTKTSFLDMKNMERFKERDAMIIARRGVINEDNMEPQTTWRALIEVEDVPAHPNGNQSKQRKIQADREMTTLRALYFAPEMIPDAPVEADLEPHSAHDVPIIPLEDLTGNPDAVNNYTDMPWPEPKGSPRHGENNHAGTGGLVAIGGHNELFPSNLPTDNESPFNAVGNSYATPGAANPLPQMQMPQNTTIGGMNNWPIPMSPFGPNNPIVNNNPYNSHMSNSQNMGGPPGQNFGPFGPNGNGMQYGNNNGQQFGQGGFNGPNFRPLGPGPLGNGHMNNAGMMNGPMGNMPMMNGPMGNGPMMNNGLGPRNNMRNNNNNNNNNNWRGGHGNNFDGGNNGGNGGGSWRSAGSGPNRGNMGNNGICKAFMRGHCRLGKSCKFIHPQKSKRI